MTQDASTDKQETVAVSDDSQALKERLRKVEAERDAYKQMVDDMPVNVMTCNLDDLSRTRFPWTQNWLNRSVQGGPEHDR